MNRLAELLKIIHSDSTQTNSTPYKPKSKIDVLNSLEGQLTGYQCQICRNKGIVYYERDGYEYCRECGCMKSRRALQRIKNSGLENQIKKCTFDTFETPQDFQKLIKQKAVDFVENPTGWFFIGGQVGCGKSHICTAIVKAMLDKGKEVRYMQWRDDVTTIKSKANSDEYAQLVTPLKKAEVLYIDDMFKTEKGKQPTTADINVAFEILNHRYINQDLITLISSEKMLIEVAQIDEAIGSRIYEMSNDYDLSIAKDTKKNYRLRGIV